MIYIVTKRRKRVVSYAGIARVRISDKEKVEREE